MKEIVQGETGGAIIDSNTFELGDSTTTLRELWGAEYQESDAILVAPHLLDKIERISKRERCKLSLVGHITGDQRIILKDFQNQTNRKQHNQHPVDLNLKQIDDREAKVG